MDDMHSAHCKTETVDGGFRGLLKHARNYFSATMATRALGFISLPVMTRILSPGDYGTLNVFGAYVGLLTVILCLNAHSAVSRYWYEGTGDFDSFLGTTVSLVAIILAPAFLVCLVFSGSIGYVLGLPGQLVPVLLVFVLLGIVRSLFRQVNVPQRKSMLIAKVSVAEAYLGFGAGVLFAVMMTHNRYYGVLWGRAIVGAAMGAIMIRILLPQYKWAFRRKHLRYILGYAVPLIPYALSGTILMEFDRIMINSYLGAGPAGIYSIAYAIGMLLSLLIEALFTAWLPGYFESMNEKQYARLDLEVDRFFKLVLVGAMFLMLLGGDIGKVLAGRSYHEGLRLVPVIAFGIIFTAMWRYWGSNIGYARKTVWTSIIAFAAGFCNIGLNMIFIPRYGYVAAAYTTVVSYMLMALMAYAISKWVLKLHTPSLVMLLKPLGVLIAVYAAAVILLEVVRPGVWAAVGVKVLLLGVFVPLIAWRELRRAAAYVPAWMRRGRGD